MPSLNLDLDYFTNPKVRRLVGLLGVGEKGFVIPIRLWCYVAKHHAATGQLAGYSKAEIEHIVAWRGKVGRCVDALLAAQLLDKLPPSTYVVHDWEEHAGHIVAYRERAKGAAKKKWAKLREASGEGHEGVTEKAPRDASSNAPTSHLIPSHSDPKHKHQEGEEREKKENHTPPSPQKLSVEEIRNRWNEIPGVKPCKKITGALLARVKGLSRDQPPDFWEKLLAEVTRSRFLTGRTPPAKERTTPFRADLDWVTGPINLGKTMSGKYDDSQASPGQCQRQVKRPGQSKPEPCGEFVSKTVIDDSRRELGLCEQHAREREQREEAQRLQRARPPLGP